MQERDLVLLRAHVASTFQTFLQSKLAESRAHRRMTRKQTCAARSQCEVFQAPILASISKVDWCAASRTYYCKMAKAIAGIIPMSDRHSLLLSQATLAKDLDHLSPAHR
mmetsp:Transcript_26344/g.51205  ORF Transcript_26344/g.51205 Transcript_26344/m.51205 type:complete len:109 (+) Transcript_26344:60-386(+)